MKPSARWQGLRDGATSFLVLTLIFQPAGTAAKPRRTTLTPPHPPGLKAGAVGLLYSRKYSEMRLANLAAAGRAVRDFKG